MKENWRDVVGYEGIYEISDYGVVRSRHGGKVRYRKYYKDKYGYMRIVLRKNGKMKTLKVHKIVWEAFNGPIPSGMQIDHINTVRDDNRLENLRVTTPRENQRNPITIERIREANRRKAKDPKWQQKNREAAQRRQQNPEWLKKVRESMKKRSENQEWRNNQREGVRRARGKAVFQLDKDTFEIIKRWDCISDAERGLGVSNTSISECCNGKRSVAGGFKWKFA